MNPGKRVAMLVIGGVLVAVALFAHVWTRGDVALGLFGGRYCNGVSCEDWSWQRMQVADAMTTSSYLLLFAGLATLGLTLAALANMVAVAATRLCIAVTAMCAIWFVFRFCGAFNHAPPIGWGGGLFGIGLGLIWTAVPPGRLAAPLPEARVTDEHSRRGR